MREIKFRLWDKALKLMVGNRKNDFFSLRNDGFVAWQNNKDNSPENTILLQYTGLKDKNGKEIYEGDVVEINFGYNIRISQVSFVKGRFELKCLCGCNKFYFGAILNEPIKITGNIYENPELLNDALCESEDKK